MCEGLCRTAAGKRLYVFLLVLDDLEVDKIVGSHGAGRGIKTKRRELKDPE